MIQLEVKNVNQVRGNDGGLGLHVISGKSFGRKTSSVVKCEGECEVLSRHS